MVKDIYRAVEGYKKRIEALKNDKEINHNNKKLFLEWLNTKEDELKRRKGADEVAKIRYYKTLSKYIALLRGTNKLFNNKDLSTITEEDIKKLYFDLEEGKIKYAKSTRKDYYNKVFKSSFFEFIGKKEIAKKIITIETDDDQEIKFFEKKDLDLMARFSNNIRNKLFLYFLFDTGVRIGTALNLQVRDCEKRHNIETKRDYYLIHIKKSYTKSNSCSDIPLLLNETNELLSVYLKEKNKEDFLFDFGYTNARVLIKRVSDKAKVKTKPEGKHISIHDFRRSCATYLLGKGYSVDFIKSRLGHKPSSTVIDRYVSYLGLKDELAVTQAQGMEYNDLKVAYKEAIERITAVDSNLKQTQTQQKELIDKQNIYSKIMEDLVKKNPKSKGILDFREAIFQSIKDTLLKDPEFLEELKKVKR